jgi:cytochrome c biogenesis protein CcdA/thiol-disulfide isomerase/thioredoxin
VVQAPTIGLAFLAGFLSFISPCVLPLVPAYIGYMGGRLTHTAAARAAVGGIVTEQQSASQRFVTLMHGFAFVAGFTFIFVVLGLLATAFVVQVGRQNLSIVENVIARVGGIVIIFFGLHFMGVLPRLFHQILIRAAGEPSTGLRRDFLLLSLAFAVTCVLLIVWALEDVLLALPLAVIILAWMFVGGAFTSPVRFWEKTIGQFQRALYSEVRMQMSARGGQGLGSSALMGVVFAAGWTPCIGPVYGAVLTMAANGGDVGQAGALLGAYSLGLGIPFLATALLLDSAQGVLRRVQRHMHTIELVTGGFLVFIGMLIATGQLQQLSARFAVQFTDVSTRVETCGLGVAQGEIAAGDLDDCLNGALETVETDGEPADIVSDDTSATVTNPLALNSITGLADSASEAGQDAVYGVDPGNRAQNFGITTLDGQTMMLSDLRGKVVLLNFWATWCGPCRVEMPAFQRVYSDYGDEGFVVVAVNNRESADLMRDFSEDIDLTYPLALDEDGAIQDLYLVRQYPTTLLIGRDGVILNRRVGPMNVSQLESLVSESLS